MFQFSQAFVENATNLAILLASIGLAIIFLKIATAAIKRHFEGESDKALVKERISIYQYSLGILVIFALVVVFSNVFKNVLASVGILAAGLAIALQRPILNVFGWLTIVIKKPYAIGDRVSIGTNKGDVFDINIMHTNMSELQDDAVSGRMIAVPNEYVLTQPITNYTKGTPYIWDTLSIMIEKEGSEEEASKLLLDATEKVVGTDMKWLSKKWSRSDHRRVSVKPEITVEIIVVNGASAIQLTSRYLCNVREKKSVRTKIYNTVLDTIKHASAVKLK